jgi:hypothetical protein
MPENKNNTTTNKSQYQKRKENRARLEIEANGIHAKRWQLIKPFVDFDIDARKPLSAYQKSKLRTYAKEVTELTARPYMPYKPRKAGRLRKAQLFAQHEKQLSGLKVAFIPTNGIEEPKISFAKNGDLISSTEFIDQRFLPFDPSKVIEEPVQHAIDTMKKSKAKQFTILAGKFEISTAYSKKAIPEAIAALAFKYKSEELNNYFGNWMVGLGAYTFKNQDNFDAYFTEKTNAKKAGQLERRNRKRRDKRAVQKAKEEKKANKGKK